MKRLANRTHRRVLVADGKVGMTGGVGIAEEWTGDAEDADHWRDTHVRVRGPVVRGFQGTFAENWLEATGEVLAGDAYLPDLDPIADGGPMQLVRSSAKVGDTNAEALYYLAIASARESIDLTAAYFVPRPAFTDALCSAAERGAKVRIVVPGPHIDKGFVRVAGRAAYERLTEAGVELYEYQPTMLHAKSMVVDGAWSSVGTVNFDNRSFQLHDEVTLCVWDERFAGRLLEAFEHDVERSRAGRSGALERPRPAPARRRARRRPSSAASSEAACGRPCLAAVSWRAMAMKLRSKRRERRGLLPGRRVPRRNPVLAALGDADQAVLRALRTRGHAEPVETMMQAIGMCGEYAAVWVVAGAVGASIDEKRRRQWLAGGATGPLAVVANYAVKVAVGRKRPLIEDHPALAKAPSKLSFPSRPRDVVARRGDRARHGSSRAPARRCSRSPPRSASAGPTSGCTTPPTCSPARCSAPSSGRSSPGSATRRPRTASSSSRSTRTSARSETASRAPARIA